MALGGGIPGFPTFPEVPEEDDAVDPTPPEKLPYSPPDKPIRGAIISIDDPDIRYTFALNPEGFPDRKTSMYAETQVPGISHPIMSWSHGGPREVDLDLLITRDTSTPPVPPGALQKIGQKVLGSAAALLGPGLPFQPNSKDPAASITNAPKLIPVVGDLLKGNAVSLDDFENSYSILEEILILRSFLYPLDVANDQLGFTAPTLLAFNYGPFYSGFMFWVMTKCDIEWKLWTENLIPIRATARIQLKEFVYGSVTSKTILNDIPPPQAFGAEAEGLNPALGVIAIGAIGIAAVAGGGIGGTNGSFSIGGFGQQFGKK